MSLAFMIKAYSSQDCRRIRLSIDKKTIRAKHWQEQITLGFFFFFFFSLSAVCNKERNITAKVVEHNSTKYDPLCQKNFFIGSDLEDSKIIMPVYTL